MEYLVQDHAMNKWWGWGWNPHSGFQGRGDGYSAWRDVESDETVTNSNHSKQTKKEKLTIFLMRRLNTINMSVFPK